MSSLIVAGLCIALAVKKSSISMGVPLRYSTLHHVGSFTLKPNTAVTITTVALEDNGVADRGCSRDCRCGVLRGVDET